MFRSSFRAAVLLILTSMAIYGAATLPAGAFQTGKDMLTVALILTVNSLS